MYINKQCICPYISARNSENCNKNKFILKDKIYKGHKYITNDITYSK